VCGHAKGEETLKTILRRAVGITILSLASLASPGQQLKFSGSVRAGETYLHNLGGGLVLVVTTSSIEVVEAPPGQYADDFTGCVTPPYHGPNPVLLDAWQFVGEKNEPLPASELDVLREREFQFTLNKRDNKAACENLDAAEHAPPRVAKDGTEVYGTPGYRPPRLGSGELILSDIKLSGVGAGKHAEIESLTFDVTIILPRVNRR
jgi:hypothetical protein